MAEFGDDEPEDAWDATDPPKEQIRNLLRRVALLREGLEAFTNDRERLRFQQLEEDLNFVIGRL
jgi:hypothetical protein